MKMGKTMEKEKIERAAMDYVEQYYPAYHPFKKHDINLFTHGARWRINSVWHEAKKELPEYDKEVLVEYELEGFKSYRLSKRVVDTKYIKDKINAQGFFTFNPDITVVCWAYLADLLPDTRQEAEP